MNKQKTVFELLLYLVILIVGIIILVNGYDDKEVSVFPEPNTPKITDEKYVPNKYITDNYEFKEGD